MLASSVRRSLRIKTNKLKTSPQGAEENPPSSSSSSSSCPSSLCGPFKATQFVTSIARYLLCHSACDDCRWRLRFVRDESDAAGSVPLSGAACQSPSCGVLAGWDLVGHVHHYLLTKAQLHKTPSRENAERVAALMLNFRLLEYAGITASTKAKDKVTANTANNETFRPYKSVLYRVKSRETAGRGTRRSFSSSALENLRGKESGAVACKRLKVSADDLHQSHTTHRSSSCQSLSAWGSGAMLGPWVDGGVLAGRQTNADTFSAHRYELLKETSLQRLLQLIDLELLDDLLCYVCGGGGQEEYQVVGAGGGEYADDLCNILLSLCHLLHLEPVRGEAGMPTATYKLHMCQLLLDHFNSGRFNVFPASLNPIFKCIGRLLSAYQDDRASLSLQYLTLVLPHYRRQWLHTQLTFLRLAAADKTLRLGGTDSDTNLDFLTNAFLSAFFQADGDLSRADCEFLVRFLVVQFDVGVIGAVPRDVEAEVDARFMFSDQWPHSHSSYCEQVSMEEYQRQQVEYTNTQILDMVRSVSGDGSLDTKQKTSFMKKVEKTYPRLLKEY